MVIGILQIELAIDGARSLKDKRRVVSSIKDKIHRDYQVSVAEVDCLEDCRRAVLGITMAANEVAHCQSTLDRVLDKIKAKRDCHLTRPDTHLPTGH